MSTSRPPTKRSKGKRKNMKDIIAENATLEVIKPHDLPHKYANLNGVDYHYLDFPPLSPPRGTILLIHGWPDQPLAWRYQIPLLRRLGLRVLCPSLPGFGRTSAPSSLSHYSLKSVSAAFAALAASLGITQLFVGGHDWGAAVAWRFALWHPKLVTHVFAVCVPYKPPIAQDISLEGMVARAPSYTYMLAIAKGDVEAHVQSREEIRQFLSGMYGGKGKEGGRVWVATEGFRWDVLRGMGESPLVKGEVLEYYVEEFARNGLGPACNWYRTRQINYEEDLEFVNLVGYRAMKTLLTLPLRLLNAKPSRINVNQPTLMITASYDDAVLPEYARGMEKFIPNLTLREVPTSHWALWEGASQVNDLIEQWIEGVVFGGQKTLPKEVNNAKL